MGGLQRVRALVQMLADELHQLDAGRRDGEEEPEIGQRTPCASEVSYRLDALAAVARRYSKLRRRRTQCLAAAKFADPGWDIMINLFAAGVDPLPAAWHRTGTRPDHGPRRSGGALLRA